MVIIIWIIWSRMLLQPRIDTVLQHTEGLFQVPPIPAAEFRGNLSVEQLAALDEVLDKQRNTILALIPHGAGKAINMNAANIVKDCQQFLASLAFEENDRKPYKILIHPPDVCNRGGPNSSPFGKPWTFILRLPHNAKPLRNFLLWQRVFALSKTASFTIYELGNKEHMWDIYPIVGLAVEEASTHAEVLEQKALLLYTIKTTLEENDFIGKIGSENLQSSGNPADTLKTIANTFHLERTEAMNANGKLVPAYVLMEPEEYAVWRNFTIDEE
ncbi:hypothetical protein GY45DRAFT_1341170 [Cubamyces sp. BRFM 1775]|nr:hypothetical protein GY45DRAFT_1341170 [Cubamyces sp. BRFM 1775]